MKKAIQLALAAAVILTGGVLGAKEYDNILLYKNCGTWKHDGKVINTGTDAGRIAWDGKVLRFTPRGGSFDLNGIYCFGFGMRVPKEMTNTKFYVKFLYEEGEPVVWSVRTPAHTGWRGACVKIQPDQGPRIRPGKIRTLEFTCAVPGFQAVLDDIRFVPSGLDFQFEEAWVPPVTDGCFFPEYTLEQQRTETLNDPDFKAKMAEIEKLRHTKLKMVLRPEDKANMAKGLELLARIRPDGSVEGLSYEEVVRINKKQRAWHDPNETFMLLHCQYYNNLLRYWEFGKIPRTDENRKKIFKSLIRTLTAESNRREECFRYVIPAFVLPSMACRAYRVFFDEMEAVEKGTNTDPDAIRLNRLLKEAASWCYFHTFYNTIGPALTIDSFRGDSNWTGGNFGYRPTFLAALICRNPKMLDVISAVAKGALSLTSYNTMKYAFWLDGMTADGSAWGHQNQNYPFGYPMDGFEGIARLIDSFTGTRWALETGGPSFDALCNYMEALLWHGTDWAKNDTAYLKVDQILQRDIPVACGRRGLSCNGRGKGYGDFGKAFWIANHFLKQLPEGSEQRNRLQHCADVMSGKIRSLPEGTRYFWNNDLLLCREKESIAAVSMLSSRVRGIESAPSASHMTDFWSDGAAWILKHPDSYRIARGFLEPCAIPGVTSRQWEFTHKDQKWRTYAGGYNFAGGAADGAYAVCGYKMGRKKHHASKDPNFYDLDADKSYFWLNGKLLCIGTGITDKTQRNVPVATTVDQTLWRGPAVLTPETARKPGETFQAETQLLQHDGVGYAVLQGKGRLSGETRQGRWVEYDPTNRTAKDMPKSAPILLFQIDHGKNVSNGSYAYVVDFHCPDFGALKKLAQEPPFEIVAATVQAHVVREKKSGTLAAVFFQPGEAGGLSVDAPAVVLLRQTPDGDVRVTVSDPEQDPKRHSVMVGWNGKHYEIQLPGGLYCGQPTTVNLSKLKPLNKEKIMKRTAIALALTAALCCPAQNLIKNADFQKTDEKGKLVSWIDRQQKFTCVDSDQPGKTGGKAVMTKVAMPEGKKVGRSAMTQKVTLGPGKYRLVFTAKVIGSGFASCEWSCYDKDDKSIKVKKCWTPVCNGPAWKTVTHEMVIPEGTAYIYLSMTGYVSAAYKHTEGAMYFTGISLTPVEGGQAAEPEKK